MSSKMIDTADAALLHDAILALAGDLHGPYGNRQRFVPLLTLRTTVDLPSWRFDRAARELASTYHAWLRIDWTSTAEDDAASVWRNAQDFHQISADPWRIPA